MADDTPDLDAIEKRVLVAPNADVIALLRLVRELKADGSYVRGWNDACEEIARRARQIMGEA